MNTTQLAEALDAFETSDALGDGDFSVCRDAAAELRRLQAEVEALRAARKITQATVKRKLDDGLDSQGWTIVGRGGTWAAALKPLMEYLTKEPK